MVNFLPTGTAFGAYIERNGLRGNIGNFTGEMFVKEFHSLRMK